MNPGMMVDHYGDRDGDQHEDDQTKDHENHVANMIINDQRSDDQDHMVAKNRGGTSKIKVYGGQYSSGNSNHQLVTVMMVD